MLLVVPPTADVLVSVGPHERALSVLLAILEVSLVLATVAPRLRASALHIAHSELALIELVHICEEVLALSLKLPIHEVSFVVAAILPVESTLSAFLSLEEISSVSVLPIVPTLLSLAMLQVIRPLTHVPSAVGVYECALSVRLVVLPNTLVDVSVGMGHPTVAIALAHSPGAFVFRTIRPQLHSKTISLLCPFVPIIESVSMRYSVRNSKYEYEKVFPQWVAD